jgi:hypothetical protein
MAAQRDARTARNRIPRGVDDAKRLRVLVERLEEETTLGQEFLRAHRTIIDKMAEQMMRDHNLPLEWFDVLIHLAEVPDGRLRQRALRDRLRRTRLVGSTSPSPNEARRYSVSPM